MAGTLLAGPAAAERPCAPWPDEPTPLPSVRDADVLRARWATLRLRELDAAARALEPGDPARARVLREHATCIASGDAALAGRAAESLPAVTVHRPELTRRDSEPAPGDAWASLSAPIGVGAAERAAPTPRPAARAATAGTAAVDALVAETAEHVREARFEAALASAERARHAVAALPRTERAGRSARLEVSAATAALALGRDAEARASLSRALDANPALELDAATPPKVRRALEAVRAERAR